MRTVRSQGAERIFYVNIDVCGLKDRGPRHMGGPDDLIGEPGQFSRPVCIGRVPSVDDHIHIALKLFPSDTTENLLYREADIAVRMYRPTQLDMIARHIGDLQLGLYGAQSYLERRSRPRVADDLLLHDVVGYDRNDLLIHGFEDQGVTVTRDFFRMRCDHQSTHWELVRAGCGLGFSQVVVARADPSVEWVLPDLRLPALPVWLTAPRAMRRTPRIAKVWELLAAGLQTVCRETGGA